MKSAALFTVVTTMTGAALVAGTPPTVTLAKVPLHFEANQGQMDSRVQFRARGSGFSVGLTRGSALLTVGQGAQVEMKLVGASPAVSLRAAEPLPGKVNYFLGREPRNWRRDVPTYGKVEARGVYPGIDLVYYGNQRQLEYDFVVAPGADPRRIGLEFVGAKKVEVEAGGGLRVEAGEGVVLSWRKPVVYQEVGGKRREVAGRYEVRGENGVGFAVGGYDRKLALVIDPVLEWSTALVGGNNTDAGYGIAVDSTGASYVTGYTYSSDFPVANAAFPGYKSNGDVFITKLNPAGNALVYSTYLGGSGFDMAYDIAVDSAGAAYVTGYTSSTDFPVMSAAQPTSGGSEDAFVAKLNAAGNGLVFSSYHGGSDSDYGRGIAVDPVDQSVYVTGYTLSANFPLQSPLRSAYQNGEAFLTRFSPAGNSRIFSTYLGGNASDFGYDVAVDSSRVPYVVGYTWSNDIPIVPSPGIQQGYRGGVDCFVISTTAAGSAYRYSQYLGGTSGDYCTGIAADNSQAAYVTGETYSSDFPLVGPIQPTHGGSADVLIAKIVAAGTSLAYSTYWGGAGYDTGQRIAVDASGRAHVAGNTQGTAPTVSAIQPMRTGGSAFLYKSADAGANWVVPAPGPPSSGSYGIVINPIDSAVLYTGSFYKSTDGGANWLDKRSGLGPVSRVTIAPTNPSVLYASTCCYKMYRSDNAGDTWQEVSTGWPSSRPASSLVVDPTNPQIAYGSTQGSGVYKTTNAGSQWTASSNGLGSSNVFDLAIHPGNPGTLWAATANGVYKSTSGGASWAASNTGMVSPYVQDLAVAPSAPHILYAVAAGYVNKSTNGGATWAAVGTGLPGNFAGRVAVDPINPNVVYVSTTGWGLWKSANGGDTWAWLTSGLPGEANLTIPAVDPLNPSVVYAPSFSHREGLVAVVNPAGSAFVFATHLGGTSDDQANAVATDSSGATYVAGSASTSTFPTTPDAFQPLVGLFDAWAAKLSSAQPACNYRLVTNPSPAWFPHWGGTGSVSVVAPSGCPWVLTSAPWVRLSASFGTGVKPLLLSIDANPGASRTTNIAAGGVSVPVTQPGSTCTYALSSDSRTVDAAGGVFNVALTTPAGCPWAVSNPASWVTVTSALSGTGDTTVAYAVAPSTLPGQRSRWFSVGDTLHWVYQNGTCNYAVTPAQTVLPASGGSGTATIAAGAGCGWSVSGWPSWVTMTSATSGSGNGTVSYSVATTGAASSRSGDFWLYGTGGGTSLGAHTVRQNGTACSFSLYPASENAGAPGAARTFQVYAPSGCYRNVVSDVAWLSVGAGATGDGNGTISYAIAPNTGGAARTGTLSSAGFSFTVNQAGGYSGPSFDSVTPSTGSGSVQTFEARYSHTAGAAALQWAQLMFAAAADGGGQSYCLVHYDRNGNGLWLYSDIYGFFAGPVAPGAASSALHGSLCAVDTQATSVEQAGNQLLLRVKLVFKQNVWRRIYLRAMGQGNVDTNWREFGDWYTQTAPGGSPWVTPAHGATATADLTATFPDRPFFSSLNKGWVEVMVAAAADGGGQPFCFVHYDRAGRGLWLYSNDTGWFLGPVTPGQTSPLLNSSACQVATQQAVATEANPFTLQLRLQLKAAMQGLKKVYLRSYDSIKQDSGWVQSGHWTIP